MLAVQGVVTYVVYPAVGQGAGGGGILGLLSGRIRVMVAASWLGLISPVWIAVVVPGQAGWSTSTAYDEWITWAPYLLVVTVSPFLLPAFAALAFAPDRQSGRLHEYRLTSLGPRHILLASGLASLLPFAAATLLTLALHVVMAGVLAAGASSGMSVSAFIEQAARYTDLPHALYSAGAFVVRAGILVSISALCRHTRAALALCYAVEFLLDPVVAIAWINATCLLAPGAFFGSAGSWVTSLSFVPELLLAAVLLPLAIRAVGREDG